MDQPTEDVGPLNGHAGILATGEGGTARRWALVTGSVWPMAGVVPVVVGDDGSELTFADDQ